MKAAVTIASSLIAFALPAFAEEGHHWSYSGEGGPAHWGESCAVGKAQSPIDIHTKSVKQADLPAIEFDYKPSPLKIVDNGHTVMATYAPGSFITVDGTRYELQQFHFHHPSEEKLDGKSYDMVAHLVHKDAHGNLAVVAVPLKKGSANALVGTLWKNIPKEKGKEAEVASATINVADLLPAQHGYYTFQGSLTTPPCSEGVRWFVLKSPSTISAQQVSAFGKLYSMNARPVQPLNGREVTASK